MAQLQLSDGSLVDLDDRNKNSVGKGRAAKVRLNDRTVAMRHASIYCESGTWYVKDSGSANGTFVGGTKLGKNGMALQGQIELKFGNVKVQFLEHGLQAQAQAQPQAAPQGYGAPPQGAPPAGPYNPFGGGGGGHGMPAAHGANPFAAPPPAAGANPFGAPPPAYGAPPQQGAPQQQPAPEPEAEEDPRHGRRGRGQRLGDPYATTGGNPARQGRGRGRGGAPEAPPQQQPPQQQAPPPQQQQQQPPGGWPPQAPAGYAGPSAQQLAEIHALKQQLEQKDDEIAALKGKVEEEKANAAEKDEAAAKLYKSSEGYESKIQD
ncbi:MAG: FHA domain-containing protein, partial [Planctomycetota bacterium]